LTVFQERVKRKKNAPPALIGNVLEKVDEYDLIFSKYQYPNELIQD